MSQLLVIIDWTAHFSMMWLVFYYYYILLLFEIKIISIIIKYIGDTGLRALSKALNMM